MSFQDDVVFKSIVKNLQDYKNLQINLKPKQEHNKELKLIYKVQQKNLVDCILLCVCILHAFLKPL